MTTTHITEPPDPGHAPEIATSRPTDADLAARDRRIHAVIQSIQAEAAAGSLNLPPGAAGQAIEEWLRDVADYLAFVAVETCEITR
jgi:hypothetical protein